MIRPAAILLAALLCCVFTARSEEKPSAPGIPTDLTDPGDRETFAWLLERQQAKPQVRRSPRGELQWIGLDGESMYHCSLHLDEKGRVIKLMFNGIGFHNDELETLAGFRHVRSINCAHNFDENGPNGYREGPNPVSGAGWSAFQDHHIEFFKVGGSPFDGDGLKAVARFPHLRELSVFHTRVNDEDLAALEGHPKLESLYAGPMWSPNITDLALQRISRMPAMKRIRIVETYLSYDAGFSHVVQKLGDQVTEIDIGNTVVPPADLERLKEALPNAEIRHDPMAEIGKLILENWKGADRKLAKWAPKEVLDLYRAAAEPEAEKE